MRIFVGGNVVVSLYLLLYHPINSVHQYFSRQVRLGKTARTHRVQLNQRKLHLVLGTLVYSYLLYTHCCILTAPVNLYEYRARHMTNQPLRGFLPASALDA